MRGENGLVVTVANKEGDDGARQVLHESDARGCRRILRTLLSKWKIRGRQPICSFGSVVAFDHLYVSARSGRRILNVLLHEAVGHFDLMEWLGKRQSELASIDRVKD